MRAEQRRIKSVLAQRGLKISDVPLLTGFSMSTIYRALSGGRTGRRVKQAIANALSCQVGDVVPNERLFLIPAGTQIEVLDDDQVGDFRAELGDAVTLKTPRKLTFVRPITVQIQNISE